LAQNIGYPPLTQIIISKLGLDLPYRPEAERRLETYSLLNKIKEMKINQAMKRAEEDKLTEIALALKSLQLAEQDPEYQALLKKKAELVLQSIQTVQRSMKKFIVNFRKKKQAIIEKKMEERNHFFYRSFIKVNFMNNKVLSA
jgi:hypothetical protein